MDGMEAAAIINEMNTGIPIVAMTANIMSDDRELYLNNGMSGFIGKPFTSQELLRCLLQYFKPVNWQTEYRAEVRQAEDDIRKKLIRKFIETNKGKHIDIENALNSGDINLAHRLAHTLKSNAGQIKKTSLQEVAAEIEDNLSDGKNRVTTEQLQTLATELNSVIKELTQRAQE